MQPRLEKVPQTETSSIFVKREVTPYMDYPWHYHPECEIIFVEKSFGVRLMGSHIGNFSDGDLMFIGSNLPHVWKNDMEFYQERKDRWVDVYVIQFLEEALTKDFFDLPEFIKVRKIFKLGQQGILIKGTNHRHISNLIKKVYTSSGIERISTFLTTLDAIATNMEYELLSSPGYANSINDLDADRINKVMRYFMENFSADLDLDKVADLVHLNKSSFCRYFRNRTNKTCSHVLNEIRIAHSCKLITNTDLTISSICYEVGYNNISHFNRQFRLITGLSPGEYRNRHSVIS
jgi:AraC-like DNA-binding protein